MLHETAFTTVPLTASDKVEVTMYIATDEKSAIKLPVTPIDLGTPLFGAYAWAAMNDMWLDSAFPPANAHPMRD